MKKKPSKLDDLREDYTEITELNWKDIKEFKEISHIIDKAFEVVDYRITQIEEKITEIENSQIKKGFHYLSHEIDKTIKEHSNKLTQHFQLNE